MNQNYRGTEIRIPTEDGRNFVYIPSDDLKEAVNLALILGKRPLLLTGEPGAGKTLLAKAIAYEWYKDNYSNYFFEWNIKSTSKARDGLYRYDALKRLSDAQLGKDINNTQLGKEGSYFQPGALSQAINASSKNQKSILLIDEIDKADIDFPNDLLQELEKFEFEIQETGQKIQRPESFDHPLIIITSNQEKELPPAFLRRCIYFHIKFPETQQLEKIMLNRFLGVEPEEIKKVANFFSGIRDFIDQRMSGTEKKTSTSEFMDWYQIIHDLRNEKQLSTIEEVLLAKIDEYNFQLPGPIPFYQVLFKNLDTSHFFKNKPE